MGSMGGRVVSCGWSEEGLMFEV
jgi:hypothetical protein